MFRQRVLGRGPELCGQETGGLSPSFAGGVLGSVHQELARSTDCELADVLFVLFSKLHAWSGQQAGVSRPAVPGVWWCLAQEPSGGFGVVNC